MKSHIISGDKTGDENETLQTAMPKKTDFTKLPAAFIRKVQNKLNDRPRKYLGFKTPREIFEKAIAS